VWECVETGDCECGKIGGGSNPNSDWILRAKEGPSDIDHVIKLRMKWWHSVVEVYSKLDLTYQSDKLPALSGLAKVLQLLVGGQYLAGLWKGSFNFLAISLYD
jgi:hypothetical protein